MRLIGAAERAMHMMVQRAVSRRAFGKLIAEHGSFLSDMAKVFRFVVCYTLLHHYTYVTAIDQWEPITH